MPMNGCPFPPQRHHDSRACREKRQVSEHHGIIVNADHNRFLLFLNIANFISTETPQIRMQL